MLRLPKVNPETVLVFPGRLSAPPLAVRFLSLHRANARAGAPVPPPLIFRLDDCDSSAKVKAVTTVIPIRLSGAPRRV